MLTEPTAAQYALLTTPWSNGQVNRLKLIKRQMFGHASFKLLRRRVLLAAGSTQSAGEPNLADHLWA